MSKKQENIPSDNKKNFTPPQSSFNEQHYKVESNEKDSQSTDQCGSNKKCKHAEIVIRNENNGRWKITLTDSIH